MSIARRLTLALLSLVLFAGSAEAMYFSPDLVRVPIARLVANLERDLAAAKDPAARVRILTALGRLHAAGWAEKTTLQAARRPYEVRMEPSVVGGPLRAAEVDDLLWRLVNARQDGGLMGMLARPGPFDAREDCQPARLADALVLEGKVTLGAQICGGKHCQAKHNALKVISSTLVARQDGGDAPALAAVVTHCLVAKVWALEGLWVPRALKTRATLTFEFVPTEGAGLTPFYGFGEWPVPSRVEAGSAAASAAEQAALKNELATARARYAEAVALAPGDAVARLGLGWTLEQLGQKADAIAAYREAFRLAWATEKDLKFLGLGSRPIASETAGYLRPLLDPVKDATERAELAAATEQLMQMPRPVTPILIPVGPGAASARLGDVVDAEAGVAFDLDGSGRRGRWGWPTPAAGWLVYDRAGAGQIDSAIQLLGAASFLCAWDDGYQALAALDDDRDGAIAGPELAGLALWIDADMDGVSDPGEVRSLGAHGIVALATGAVRDAAGVLGNARGVRFADGSERPSWDWVVPPN